MDKDNTGAIEVAKGLLYREMIKGKSKLTSVPHMIKTTDELIEEMTTHEEGNSTRYSNLDYDKTFNEYKELSKMITTGEIKIDKIKAMKIIDIDALKADLKNHDLPLVENINSHFVKFSHIGDIESNAKPADYSKLNYTQKAIADFSKNKLGVSVIYIEDDPRIYGKFENRTIYLNVKAKESFAKTFWHELAHWMAANNQQLFGELVDKLSITKEQIEQYKKATNRKELTDNEVKEEMIADNMFDTSKRLNLFTEIGKTDRPFTERLISWIQSLMQKFIQYFNKKEYGLTNTQKNIMYDDFGVMVRQIVDENGAKVFRYSNTRKVIELNDGRKLPEFIDNEAEMDDNIVNELFDEYLTPELKKSLNKLVPLQVASLENNISEIKDENSYINIRESLQYINALNNNFHYNKIQKNENIKRVISTALEYARRLFDNDERIRKRVNMQMVNGNKQRRISEIGQTTISRRDNRGIDGTIPESISRKNITGERDGIMKRHLQKVYHK